MGSAKKIKNHDVNSKTRTARANELKSKLKLKSFSELLYSQGEVMQSNFMFLFFLFCFHLSLLLIYSIFIFVDRINAGKSFLCYFRTNKITINYNCCYYYHY